MTNVQPLVCIFFQLPPSDKLFMRIHDIPWLVLLPQIEKLTYALEKLLDTNPSSTAMRTLIKARRAMGSKMILLRDAILSSRDLSVHYFGFVNNAYQNRRLPTYVKHIYIPAIEDATNNIERAQKALFEFREELESIVSRITSLVGGDKNYLSQFTTKSSQIISVMVPAIEECSALFQECSEGFKNLYKQNYDPESFDRNLPSDAEFQLAGEKWKVLLNSLHEISPDWNVLDACMRNPYVNRAACETETPDVRDTLALTGVPEGPINSEASQQPSPPRKVKIPFWRKLFHCVSACFSSRPIC